jgi:hypothetical protein
MTSSSRRPQRRVQAAEPAPGVAKIRLSGDPAATDALTMMLRSDPAVEILTGPDKYSDGRQYLTVRMLPHGEVLGALLRAPGRDEDATAAPEPRLLSAPCDRFEQAGASGLCASCQRSWHAHQVAAAAAAALWPDDDETPGGTT